MPKTVSSTLKRTWLALAACALVLLSVVVAGCGDAVPADAVAKVGDTVITKSDFNHFVALASAQQAAQTGVPQTTKPVYDPPNFTQCAAQKAKQPVPPGVPKPKTSDLVAQCKSEFTGLRTQTMQFLISAQWLLQASQARHITVTDAQVRTLFNQQKAQAFKQESQYQAFLKSSGQTEQDLLFRIKLSLLTNKLQAAITASAKPVTSADVTNYYSQNKQRFATPETRDLLVVLTTQQSQAQAALKAINSGQPWAQVAKKYSTDASSKAQGGKLPGVTRGQQEQSFDAAIFSAKQGAVVGPVKTQFGYYVFRVTNITAAKQQSLAQASATISNLLKSQRQQAALTAFVKSYQKKYQAETQCAKDYAIPQQCANGPKATATTPTTPATGGAQQSAP